MNELAGENLFRQQAIDSLRRKPPGRPICLMPRPWLWLGALLISLLFCSAFFIATVEYSRKEVARGWLVSDHGVIRIAHSSPALIRRVAKSVGETVVSGEPLLYLSADSLMSTGNSKSEQLLGQIRQDIAELDIQLALSQQRDGIEAASLDSQLKSFDVEQGSLRSQIGQQESRIEISADKLERLRSAASGGAISDWDLLQQEQELGTLHQEFEILQQKIAGQQRAREFVSGRRSEMPATLRIEKSLLRVKRSQLMQQIAELESRKVSVLSSPIDGTIASVEVHAGNAAVPQQLLMTILPENVELSAEIYVPSRAVGFIRSGQLVRLAYDAFPKQRFGTFDGRVEHVSDFVLLPNDVPKTFPIHEATYKIRVELADTKMETALGNARLRPGMLLVAELVLEKRSLIHWLLEPLGLSPGRA